MAFKIGKLKFRFRQIEPTPTPPLNPFFPSLPDSTEFTALSDILVHGVSRPVFEYNCVDGSDKRIDLNAADMVAVLAQVVFYVGRMNHYHQFQIYPRGAKKLMDRTLTAAQLTPPEWITSIQKAFGVYYAQAPIDDFKAFFGPNKSFRMTARTHYAYFRMAHKQTRQREWMVLALPVGVTFSGQMTKNCDDESPAFHDWYVTPEPQTSTFFGGTEICLKLTILDAKKTLAERRETAKKQSDELERVRDLKEKHDGTKLGKTYKKSEKQHKKAMDRADRRVREAKQRLKDLRAKLGDLVEDQG